jgi:hypothetical protein
LICFSLFYHITHHITMRNFAALGLLGAAALAAASDVVDLKQDTFKGFVEENDLVLAECEFRFSDQYTTSTYLIIIQSSPPGADTARLSHPSTRRPPLPSRRRTLLWPRLTAPRRPTSAVTTVSRATLPSRSSEASTMSPPTAASARPLRTLYRQQHNLGAQLTILQHHLIHDQAVPPCRLYRRQGHH